MTSPSITIDLTPQGTMERLEWLAWFSDSAIRIPGTSRSVGADGVLIGASDARKDGCALGY